jgi:hypothetical protein
MIYDGINHAFKEGYIKREDQVVVVAGSLLGLPSSTNLIQCFNVNEIISSKEALDRFVKAYELDINQNDI